MEAKIERIRVNGKPNRFMFHVKQPRQTIEKQTKRCSTWNVSGRAARELAKSKKKVGFHVEQMGGLEV